MPAIMWLRLIRLWKAKMPLPLLEGGKRISEFSEARVTAGVRYYRLNRKDGDREKAAVQN